MKPMTDDAGVTGAEHADMTVEQIVARIRWLDVTCWWSCNTQWRSQRAATTRARPAIFRIRTNPRPRRLRPTGG